MLSHFFRKLRPQSTEPLKILRSKGMIWRCRIWPPEEFISPQYLQGLMQVGGLSPPVKQNLQRTIWRIALPRGVVYVKLCRTNTPRAWLREILRPPKARLEFENALALLSLGIGCIEPVAWGMSDGLWPGTSIIVTREQANAEPLDRFLEKPLSPQRRREIAVAFGDYAARLFRCGVNHPDAHPGNFLVEWIEGSPPRFFLLDLHAIEIAPQSADRNLVPLNRWFQMRASRTDRLRFWRSYCRTLSITEIGKARVLESETRQSNLRFWANRLGRYLGNNREYRKVRGRGVRGHAVRDLPAALQSQFLADPDFAFADPQAKLLKDSRSSTVAVLTHDSRLYVFKRFRRGGLFAGFKNFSRPSSALRSWIAGQSLRDRGLSTARPLAVLHRIRAGLPREGYLIFEFVMNAVELPQALGSATRDERLWLIDALGRLLRDLHDRGISHRDLKAPNILIADGKPVLIDLVGVQLSESVSERERIRNLARLNASFFASGAVSLPDRLRFLKAYRSWSTPRPVGDWKVFWRVVAVETLTKVEKNRRAGRVLA